MSLNWWPGPDRSVLSYGSQAAPSTTLPPEHWNEGASNLTLTRPPALKLLSQVRRAATPDQLEVLTWLVSKFPKQAKTLLEHSVRLEQKGVMQHFLVADATLEEVSTPRTAGSNPQREIWTAFLPAPSLKPVSGGSARPVNRTPAADGSATSKIREPPHSFVWYPSFPSIANAG